jgi:hypothetical protein
MNNGRIWDIVHTILKKEPRGNILKPARFSHLLEQCNLEYYNQQYEKWSGSQLILDSLQPFIVLDETVTFTTGSANVSGLAEDYKHLIAARHATSDAKVDVVSPNEWNEWIGDAVMKGTTSYPLMTANATALKVYPTDITSLTVSYLRKPTTPIFDYYYDAQYTVQYLTEGQPAYELQTGEVGSGGETAGTEVTSASVDLEWNDFDIVNIISLVLEKVAISLSAPDIAQYAMGLEQKQNVI